MTQFTPDLASHLPSEAPFRAVVVSDVRLYRDGVESAFREDPDFEIIGLCSLAEAAQVVRRDLPDVIFIDVTRPTACLCSLQLAAARPAPLIIGFGVGSHDEVIACAEAGIAGFVGSDGTMDDLRETALLALKGQLVCPPDLVAKLVQRLATLAGRNAQPADTLTRREREIAALVGEGLSNKEIASALRISPATVKNHVHIILEKLAVTKRNAVARSLVAQAPLRTA